MGRPIECEPAPLPNEWSRYIDMYMAKREPDGVTDGPVGARCARNNITAPAERSLNNAL